MTKKKIKKNQEIENRVDHYQKLELPRVGFAQILQSSRWIKYLFDFLVQMVENFNKNLIENDLTEIEPEISRVGFAKILQCSKCIKSTLDQVETFHTDEEKSQNHSQETNFDKISPSTTTSTPNSWTEDYENDSDYEQKILFMKTEGQKFDFEGQQEEIAFDRARLRQA